MSAEQPLSSQPNSAESDASSQPPADEPRGILVPDNDTQNLIAAILHEHITGQYRAIGIKVPRYEAMQHWPAWDKAVRAICEAFPSLNDPFPQSRQPVEAVESERHSHTQYAIMSPDGCVDRATVRHKDTLAWAAAGPSGDFDPARVTNMQKVGYRIVRVRVDLDRENQ